jgi:hypothetical protein
LVSFFRPNQLKRAKKASVGTIASPSLEKGKKKNETPTNGANPVTANDLPPIELEKSILLSTPEGDRNNQLNRSSFNLALQGEEHEIVLTELASVARSIGLDPQEIEPTLRSGWSAGKERRIELEELEEAGPHPHLTDLGNAKRLVRDHEGEILYCFTRKKWLIWNGFWWAIDQMGEARRLDKKYGGRHLWRSM